MNPVFKKAAGLLKSRTLGSAGPMVQPKPPMSGGGDLISRMRARMTGGAKRMPRRGIGIGPTLQKEPPSGA